MSARQKRLALVLISTSGLLAWRRNLARLQHAQQTEPA